RAAEAFAALSEAYPQDELADDALVEAAQLYEEKLGDPERALALYDQLIKRYPDSRLARRSAGRAAFLRVGLGAGAEPLRRYQDIVNGYARRPHDRSIAAMEELTERWPDFPLMPQALFWLAQAYQQERRWDDALRVYSAVLARFPSSEWA